MTRFRLVVVFALAFLSLQVVVASSRLLQDRRPAAFGWQMYAGVPDRYRYELIVPAAGASGGAAADSAAGDAADPSAAAHSRRTLRQPIAAEDFVVRSRWEIDFREPMRRVLCTEHPEALAVAARPSGGGKGEWVLPCP